MGEMTRRQILGGAVGVALSTTLPSWINAQAQPARSISRVIFYQFDHAALDVLLGPGGLPAEPAVEYVFVNPSDYCTAERSELAERLRSAGTCFNYASSFDLHRHRGWRTASRTQLADWARGFVAEADRVGARRFVLNDVSDNSEASSQIVAILTTIQAAAGDSLGKGIVFVAPESGDSTIGRAIGQFCDDVILERLPGLRCRDDKMVGLS